MTVRRLQGFDSAYPTHIRLLDLLLIHRFATTIQLARFTEKLYKSHRSAVRQTLRHLRVLEQQGMITRLERRVGGWQAGSSVSIWTFTTRGYRHRTGIRKRQRSKHLSTTFLAHSLAVTEVRLMVEETVERLDSTISYTKGEPECWRIYVGPHGETTSIRPDLHLRIDGPKYRDEYFIEVDRNTENPARVIAKCHQYHQFYRLGIEQQESGMFPIVTWVVPHLKRKDQLLRALAKEPKLPKDLFTVITYEEVPDLVKNGPPQVAP